MNRIAYFEIQADDPERAVRFYREVFGWRFTKEESLPIPYWRIDTDGIRGGLLKRPARTPPPESGTNAFVCSIEVTDFDAVAAVVLQAGGRVVLPKFAIPGVCWQGYFLDPAGNRSGCFSPIRRPRSGRPIEETWR
jgi:predicted enzyme related to lactoylglutathione lyase